MLYKKINLELIVMADDADAAVTALHAVLDRLEEGHSLFGGEIEIAPVDHRGTRRKSALEHTCEAGRVAAGALRLAGEKMSGAFRTII
jgi:N-methylhydantoinase A/oxoprolinase/acetone carboxylase beta subunit